MFQFRRFPAYAYLIQRTLTGYCPAGLPHSEIPGSMDICSSPRLIAACHVLRRLLMPRHSPCALYSLTNQKQIFTCSRCELCRLHRFEIVIVTLHPFGCCSTIKILNASVSFQTQNLSVALLITFIIHCSVFKVHFFQPRLKPDLKIQSFD